MSLKDYAEGHQDSLALFSQPPVDTSVDRHMITEYKFDGNISHGTTVQFHIPGTSPHYIDLSRSRVKFTVALTKADGQPIGVEDNVGMVNFSMHALIQQADVELNQVNITSSVGRNYPFKAIFDTLVNFEEDPKETFLQAEGYYKDTAGFMNARDPDEGGNVGLMRRAEQTQSGKTWDLEGPLCVDICNQTRYIPNGVSVNIRLYPTQDSFRLMSDTNEQYQVVIRNATLKAHEIAVNPGILIGHAAAFEETNAFYPYMRSEIKTFNVATGSYDFSVDNIFNSMTPSRVIVALTSSKGYNGDYTRNPFNFHHYDVNYMDFKVNNISRPSNALKPNFTNGNYVSSYLTLFSVMGKNQAHQGNDISREDYSLGYALFCFQVFNKQTKDFMDLPRRGHTSLSMTFKHPTPEPVTVVVYAHFPNNVQIDKTRNVVV